MQRAARGSRSAGTRPGILTGVLEATVRDLQVKTPAPGFLAGSYPKVVRRHGQLAHTVSLRQRPAQTQAATRQQPQPAKTRTTGDFHAARPSTGCNGLSIRLQGRTFGAPGRPAQAETREDAQDVYGGRERAGQCSAVAARGGGD